MVRILKRFTAPISKYLYLNPPGNDDLNDSNKSDKSSGRRVSILYGFPQLKLDHSSIDLSLDVLS